tara:strand:- start:184 stop:429 length:246 start_codon:yes stop_codon:yes gene_type:complete
MGLKTVFTEDLLKKLKKKKKPANPNLRKGTKQTQKNKKTPSRKMFTPEQMKKLEKIHREAIKKGKKPKSNMPMLKRGGRAR